MKTISNILNLQSPQKNSFLKALGLLALCLSLPTSAYSANFCTKLSKKYQNKISKKFNQSPFLLVESFLNLPLDKTIKNNTNAQNNLIVASFDINRIYKSNIVNFKSKALSKVLFDWVRTQYFSNVSKNFYQKSDHLLKKNIDLLNLNERNQMSLQKIFATKINKRKCSAEEAQLLGCKSTYVITAQSAAALSCREKKLKDAFETKFYLSFSKRYGFKILDISIAGKRIVLDSMRHMISLKGKGFNTNAITSHIATLALDPNTFKLPKKQINTKVFLASIKKVDPDRLPSSL